MASTPTWTSVRKSSRSVFVISKGLSGTGGTLRPAAGHRIAGHRIGGHWIGNIAAGCLFRFLQQLAEPKQPEGRARLDEGVQRSGGGEPTAIEQDDLVGSFEGGP